MATSNGSGSGFNSVMAFIPDYASDAQKLYSAAKAGISSSSHGSSTLGKLLMAQALRGSKLTDKEKTAIAKNMSIQGIAQDIQAMPEYKQMMEIAGNSQYPIEYRIRAFNKFKNDLDTKLTEEYKAKYPDIDVEDVTSEIFSPFVTELNREKTAVINDKTVSNAASRAIGDILSGMKSGGQSLWHNWVTNDSDAL